MELNTRDFLMKTLLEEQEKVRDFQKFAQQTDDEDAARYFRVWSEEDGFRAREIKNMLQKYDNDQNETRR